MAGLILGPAMTAPEIRELDAGRIAFFSAPSPDKPTPNEDAASLIPIGPRGVILVVADGVGGMRAGREAAQRVVGEITETVRQAAADASPPRVAILDGIERAQSAVRDLGGGAATTLTAVEVADGKARTYHIGDSVALLMGQRGKVKMQTISHSPVGFAVEAGLLNDAEAIRHEDLHLVSNVIGAPDMRIEVGAWRRLSPRDTLIVGTDGVFDNLQTRELIDLIRTGPLPQAAQRLVEAVRERMEHPRPGQPSKPDDATFLIFRPNSPVPSGPPEGRVR